MSKGGGNLVREQLLEHQHKQSGVAVADLQWAQPVWAGGAQLCMAAHALTDHTVSFRPDTTSTELTRASTSLYDGAVGAPMAARWAVAVSTGLCAR